MIKAYGFCVAIAYFMPMLRFIWLSCTKCQDTIEAIEMASINIKRFPSNLIIN